MRIDFESKPVYSNDDEKYIKTKIKIYAGSVITNFHNKKMPKEKIPCKCLSIMMLDPVIKAKKKYYPQTLLKERKYTKQKIKTKNYIDDDDDDDDDVKSDSDSNDETESNTGSNGEKKNDLDNDNDNDE